MSITPEPTAAQKRYSKRIHAFQDSTAIRRLADAGPDGGDLDKGRVIAHADAAIRGGNPGACSIGVYIICPNLPDFRSVIGRTKGTCTSNVGEYLALLEALDHVKQLGALEDSLRYEKIKRVDIFMDSKLICSQVAMTWRTFDGPLIELRNQALAVMHSMVINDGKEVLLRWTHRNNNEPAHRAAHRAGISGDFSFGPRLLRQKKPSQRPQNGARTAIAS